MKVDNVIKTERIEIRKNAIEHWHTEFEPVCVNCNYGLFKEGLIRKVGVCYRDGRGISEQHTCFRHEPTREMIEDIETEIVEGVLSLAKPPFTERDNSGE